jgi:3-oxoacyl-[acyl-carrier protein] reductase
MDGQLKGKIVLVTGSSIGIGRATAIRFAQEGCRVVVTYYKDEREAEETADRCRELGAPDVLVTELNVKDDASIDRAVETVLDKHDGLDILINNAGVIVWKPLTEQTREEVEDQVRTNLEGTVKMTQACLPYLRYMITGMTSPTALRGYETLVPYSSTKAGVLEFVRSLAKEIDIPIFAVMPGQTATRMTNFEGDPPEKVAGVIVTLAKGRYDVASGDMVKVTDPPRESAGLREMRVTSAQGL